MIPLGLMKASVASFLFLSTQARFAYRGEGSLCLNFELASENLSSLSLYLYSSVMVHLALLFSARRPRPQAQQGEVYYPFEASSTTFFSFFRIFSLGHTG